MAASEVSVVNLVNADPSVFVEPVTSKPDAFASADLINNARFTDAHLPMDSLDTDTQLGLLQGKSNLIFSGLAFLHGMDSLTFSGLDHVQNFCNQTVRKLGSGSIFMLS